MSTERYSNLIFGFLGTVALLIAIFLLDSVIWKIMLIIFSSLMLISIPVRHVFKIIDVTHGWALLKQCKKIGIKSIYDSQSPKPIITNMSNASQIRILALSANTLIKNRRNELIEALCKNRALIRIMIGTAGSQFVKDVEDVESSDREGQITPEIINSEKLLTEYLKESVKNKRPEETGTIQIGYFTTQLRSSLIICNDNWCWLTLNLPPKRGLQSISFIIEKEDNGLLDDCISHFDKNWEILERRKLIKNISL